uniref:Uncharacterized protein n=1 Tax=Heterorhabditis bacteriophora TaxID=37862 RepID=A0A1I7X5I1_HETBA
MGGAPVSPFGSYLPPTHDCCGRCGGPCKYNRKKYHIISNTSFHALARSAKTIDGKVILQKDNEEKESDEQKITKCNSEGLKLIMNKASSQSFVRKKTSAMFLEVKHFAKQKRMVWFAMHSVTINQNALS